MYASHASLPVYLPKDFESDAPFDETLETLQLLDIPMLDTPPLFNVPIFAPPLFNIPIFDLVPAQTLLAPLTLSDFLPPTSQTLLTPLTLSDFLPSPVKPSTPSPLVSNSAPELPYSPFASQEAEERRMVYLLHMNNALRPGRNDVTNPRSPSYRKVRGKRAVVRMRGKEIMKGWPSVMNAAASLKMPAGRLRYLCNTSAKTGEGEYFYLDKLK